MKRSIGWIILVLVLLAGVALAGDSFPGGDYSVMILSTNTDFTGDTTLTINDDVMDGEQSITCPGKMTFKVEGKHFLVLDNGSQPAVKAKEIILDHAAVIWPEDGSVGAYGSGQTIVDKNGNPAARVILGPDSGWQAVGKSLFKTSEIKEGSLLILQDTTIQLDETGFLLRIYDPLRIHSVFISKGPGKGYLTVGDDSEIAIDVGTINMDSALVISNPRGGYCQGGQVLGYSGNPVKNVIFAPKGKYAIHADGCFAETEYMSLDSADEGDLVTVFPDWSPEGKYMAGVDSAEVSPVVSENTVGRLQYTFTMPAKEVTLKAVFEAQIPYTFNMVGKTEIQTDAELGLRGSVVYMVYVQGVYSNVDGKHCYDLNNDGIPDVIETSMYHFAIADTCSLGDQWTSKKLPSEKFSPLTFVLKEDPAPAPSTDSPAPTEVTVGQLKYKLSGSNAIVVGAKSKNAKKLTIPKAISVSGKTYKVTEIKASAFKGMKKLTAVAIGENVKTIGKSAFQGCAKLKTITIKTKKLTSSSVKSSAFKGIYKKAVFKCPKGKAKAYKKILLKKGAPKTCKFK